MKFTFSFTIALFLLPFLFLGQSRINDEELKFNKTHDTIHKAKGWVYDNTKGKWISHDNLLSNDEGSYSNGSLDSRNDQNFIFLHSKMLLLNEKNYFVLMVKKYEGHYTYPSLRQGWNIDIVNYAYIFDENQINKLKSNDTLIELSTSFIVTYDEKLEESQLINLIKLEIIKKPFLVYTFPFKSTLNDGVKVKRFYLPSIRKSNTICWRCLKPVTYVNGKWLNLNEPKKNKQNECYSSFHQIENSYTDFSSMSLKGSIYDFKYAYFEILDSEFLKIFPKN
jgi:hypothetical protein